MSTISLNYQQTAVNSVAPPPQATENKLSEGGSSLADALMAKGKISSWTKGYANDLSKDALNGIPFKGKDSLNIILQDDKTALNIDYRQKHSMKSGSSNSDAYNNVVELTTKTNSFDGRLIVGAAYDMETGEVSPVVNYAGEDVSVKINDGMQRAPSSKAMYDAGGGQNALYSEFQDTKSHRNIRVDLNSQELGNSVKVSAAGVYDSDSGAFDGAITTKVSVDGSNKPVVIDAFYNGEKDVVGASMTGSPSKSTSKVTAYYQQGIGNKNNDDFVAGMSIDTKYDNGMRTEVGASVSNIPSKSGIDATLTIPLGSKSKTGFNANVQAHVDRNLALDHPLKADVGVYTTYKF